MSQRVSKLTVAEKAALVGVEVIEGECHLCDYLASPPVRPRIIVVAIPAAPARLLLLLPSLRLGLQPLGFLLGALLLLLGLELCTLLRRLRVFILLRRARRIRQ